MSLPYLVETFAEFDVPLFAPQLLQVERGCVIPRRQVSVLTRPGHDAGQDCARRVGAISQGTPDQLPAATICFNWQSAVPPGVTISDRSLRISLMRNAIKRNCSSVDRYVAQRGREVQFGSASF
jgi:hypothetical protein